MTRMAIDGFAGELVAPGDPDYDERRIVWNAIVDRRPALIARCTSAADVAAAIRFARARDLEIAVKCGGHGILGLAVPEGGIQLDLTPMGAVRVDPDKRRAYVAGGALLGTMDRATEPHGLATTAGEISHTGVGGLTLGGGFGWLARQFGMSCDNVESYEARDRGGRHRARVRDRASRPVLGPAGRRRQLRRRHRVRVPAAPHRGHRADGRPDVRCRGRRQVQSSAGATCCPDAPRAATLNSSVRTDAEWPPGRQPRIHLGGRPGRGQRIPVGASGASARPWRSRSGSFDTSSSRPCSTTTRATARGAIPRATTSRS